MIKNKIELVMMDVDGTMTDGKIYMGESGEIVKAFNVKDGYAIKTLLHKLGIKTAIITARSSQIVENRARELDVDFVIQGVKNKEAIAEKICEQMNINISHAMYIGDDDSDIGVLKAAGLSACPYDASDNVKEVCDYVSSKNGGEGVIRDVVESVIIDR